MSIRPATDEGSLFQDFVDAAFAQEDEVTRLDLIVLAEAFDLPADLREVCSLVPPGAYTRAALCRQLNSSISGHGWGRVYGTVE